MTSGNKDRVPNIHGILAEFEDEHQLMEVAHVVCKEGYTHTEAFSPFPIEGLIEALGKKESKLPWIVFFAGLTGFITAVLLQGWTLAVDYPIIVAGRPLFSWPAFIPIEFELTVLFSAFTGVISMILLNKLPLLSHPLFNIEAFKKASRDGFFIEIESEDPKFNIEKVKEFFTRVGAKAVYEVF